MEEYPDTCAVLVRRHGVYVWGGNCLACLNIIAENCLFSNSALTSLNSLRSVESWEKAKCMSECYDYLFEIAVKMKSIGIGKRNMYDF